MYIVQHCVTAWINIVTWIERLLVFNILAWIERLVGSNIKAYLLCYDLDLSCKNLILSSLNIETLFFKLSKSLAKKNRQLVILYVFCLQGYYENFLVCNYGPAANIWRDPVYTIAETTAGHSQPLALSLSLY